MALAGEPIGQILKGMGLITELDIQEALQEQKSKGGALGRILSDKGLVTDADLRVAIAKQAGMDPIDLDEVIVTSDLLDLVPAHVAETYQVVPVEFDGKVLTLALADPQNISALDDMKFMLNVEVKGALSDPESVERAMKKYYSDRTESMESLLGSMDQGDIEVLDDSRHDMMDMDQLEQDVNAAPVVKLLNMVLLSAIKDRASDIHLEPFEKEFKIRYRVDGVLYEMMPPPIQLARAVISRVKVMANLDIAETRLPQDGRIELNISGRPVDLRVSTLPTMYGESVVMRVLDRGQVSLDLENIGLRQKDLDLLRKLIIKPNGIILVTGPTGSGKTTTLYSCLNEANDPTTKIITTEDPVEYNIDGIVQIPINEEIGVTYAACLRAILRQDPDKILVGEIRDLETAQIAVEASLTGHIVFSTLHTNDAPSSMIRLVDLGIEAFLLTATVEAVVAQRLVRRVCLECKVEYEPTDEMLMELELTQSDVQGRTFFYGKGCRECNNSGYKGRVALFEIMQMSDRLRDVIMTGASTQEVQKLAREEGMKTLRDAGLIHIYDGVTTIEEVVKETIVS
ncbi:MAG: Flp pilus assembly complex ATPase component TadA [Planctomycetes bacterium]|jgi:type IV pilus assembly protein PilB|nr:Flp pilus assembly complex ATPase component TadA [Planctomycetota bacterium]MBT6541473.1 Flp pilus assembly complex ATPase component TadA [Planctomycetota bacterium]MBT6785188.1 Flp pilus assembly complex ATPase component TadA [Planctomycetota bacterium]MBT7103336.1 Flp pilus assembly complex ATPase component TadA [Planctomycetota bacterium]MBT7639250.1 Flp pilus assembly complex ATPase component TadA [Planctomycetota bacterium]